jgi:curved DNA-binding protein
MKYKDYYKALGVARGASVDEIKKAYRRLARKYHPDVSKEKNAEATFKDVNEAYEILKDPEKRAAYDQLGTHRPGEDFRPPPGWGQRYAEGQSGFSGFGDVDLSDLFGGVFGGFGRSGPRTGRARHAAPGQDAEVAVELTLEEAHRGTERSVRFDAVEPGPGGVLRRVPKSVTVRVPPGVTHGQRLRVPGKGGAGAAGGPPGALYLAISLRAHPVWRREGHDLYLDVPLAPWEAVLGASVDVPSLDGAMRIKVAPGARAGQRLRLTGKGLARPGGGRGDLYAVLQVVTPASVSAEEKRLYEELARISPFRPRGPAGEP